MWTLAKKSMLKNVSFLMLVILVYSTVSKLSTNSHSELVLTAGTQVNTKADEMNERTQRMREACAQYPLRRQLKASLTGLRLFYISEQHKLSYCRVAKVGSTFWTQVFMTLAGVKPAPGQDGDDVSMFDVPRDEAHKSMKSHKDLQMDYRDRRVHTTTSFLVSRNPYSRLFSSYIDQIFLPNKWSHAATMVPKDSQRHQCGSDVTFEEFLSFISEKLLKSGYVDLHWAPIFSICLPCKSKFDILAKQETFNEDAQYILDLVNVDESVRKEVARATESSLMEVAIPTLVHTYVTKGHSVKKGCITESDLAKKIWTAFQIQGYIHNDETFPAEKFESVGKLDEKFLTDAIMESIARKRLTSSERIEQRHSWMVTYWKQISLPTLQTVQDAYYEDFHVFQYDLDPKSM